MSSAGRPITAADEDREDLHQDGTPSPVDILGQPPEGGAQPRQSNLRVVTEPNEPDFEMVEVEDENSPLPGAHQPPAPAAAPQEPQQPQNPDANAQEAQFGRKWSQRQRRREGRERTFAENRALKSQVESLESKLAELSRGYDSRLSELSEGQLRQQAVTIDNQLADATRAFEQAEDRYFEAMDQGNKDLARQQLKIRDEANFRRMQLTNDKSTLDRRISQGARQEPQDRQPESRQPVQQAPRQQAQPQLSPTAVAYANEFAQDFPWINQPGMERDSQVVSFLDSQVMNEGFDPGSPEYWDELEGRMQTYMPHRFAAPQPAARQAPPQAPAAPVTRHAAPAQPAPLRRGPATGEPGNGRPGGNPNQVRITPERRAALEEAGVVDGNGRVLNKQKFNRIAAGYAEQDRNDRASSAGRM